MTACEIHIRVLHNGEVIKEIVLKAEPGKEEQWKVDKDSFRKKLAALHGLAMAGGIKSIPVGAKFSARLSAPGAVSAEIALANFGDAVAQRPSDPAQDSTLTESDVTPSG
jgi:hypothetical protein